MNVSIGPRLHVAHNRLGLDGLPFALDEGASRHIQVLRLQPGDGIRLFDGQGQEWAAEVTDMGRKVVQVRLGERVANDRELPVRVTLAVGMPANDRMDAVVEKATELGVAEIQPLVCARSVLRLDGERAAKKVAHWQAVAVSASEQCGRAVVPQVHAVQTLAGWMKQDSASPVATHRGVLSLRDAMPVRGWLMSQEAQSAQAAAAADASWCFLNGPEGGLAPEEEALALAQGWTAVSLGQRVLRADTAPLAVLSVMAALFEG
jgi:16S rRNA (uracil1498-N3)-methyltransferase